jgi:adenosine deaminase
MDAVETIRALPKAEQHIHIVGSIRPETLLWLVQEENIKSQFNTIEEIRKFFTYKDFPHFTRVYSLVADSIVEESQFQRITYEMLEDEARNNVRYVEASFSAPDHVRRGLEYSKLLDSVNKGIRQARKDFGIQCNIRMDIVRNYGPEWGMCALDWVESKNDNIVSIDLGGSEERFPAKPYAQVYARAKKMGLHLVAHAGEAAGPESIWDAIRHLKVEHIGHGVAAIEDPALIKTIKDRGITIETCPISNVRTNVVRRIRDHPIRYFFDSDLSVTVNSDDPSMFGTDLNNEFLQLHKKLGFTIKELFRLSLNSVKSSFLPDKEKNSLICCFMEEFEKLILEQR